MTENQEIVQNQQPLTQEQKYQKAIFDLQKRNYKEWKDNVYFPNNAAIEEINFLMSICIDLGGENMDVNVITNYFKENPEEMEFMWLDIINYFKLAIDYLFAQTIRENYFPGYNLERLKNEYIAFKTGEGPSLTACRKNFAEGRVQALKKYWTDENWNDYKKYELNYDFIGITEYEAAFWFKLLQRIHRDSDIYQQTFIKIREQTANQALDSKAFHNDTVRVDNYRLFMVNGMYNDLVAIDWGILIELRRPDTELTQIVNEMNSYLLRVIPGSSDIILSTDDFEIRVENYYNDIQNNTINDSMNLLRQLLSMLEGYKEINIQNIPTFFTIGCIRLAKDGTKWFDPTKGLPKLQELEVLRANFNIMDMNNLLKDEDVNADLKVFASEKKKNISKWLQSKQVREEYFRKLKAAKVKKDLCVKYQFEIDSATSNTKVDIAECSDKIDSLYTQLWNPNTGIDPIDIYNQIMIQKNEELKMVNKDKAAELQGKIEHNSEWDKAEIWRYSLPVYFAITDGAKDSEGKEIPVTFEGINTFALQIAKDYSMNIQEAKEFLNSLIDEHFYDTVEKYWVAFNGLLATNIEWLNESYVWDPKAFFHQWLNHVRQAQDLIIEKQRNIIMQFDAKEQQGEPTEQKERSKAVQIMTMGFLKKAYETFSKDLDEFVKNNPNRGHEIFRIYYDKQIQEKLEAAKAIQEENELEQSMNQLFVVQYLSDDLVVENEINLTRKDPNNPGFTQLELLNQVKEPWLIQYANTWPEYLAYHTMGLPCVHLEEWINIGSDVESMINDLQNTKIYNSPDALTELMNLKKLANVHTLISVIGKLYFKFEKNVNTDKRSLTTELAKIGITDNRTELELIHLCKLFNRSVNNFRKQLSEIYGELFSAQGMESREDQFIDQVFLEMEQLWATEKRIRHHKEIVEEQYNKYSTQFYQNDYQRNLNLFKSEVQEIMKDFHLSDEKLNEYLANFVNDGAYGDLGDTTKDQFWTAKRQVAANIVKNDRDRFVQSMINRRNLINNLIQIEKETNKFRPNSIYNQGIRKNELEAYYINGDRITLDLDADLAKRIQQAIQAHDLEEKDNKKNKVLSMLDSHGLSADDDTLEKYTAMYDDKEGKRAVEKEITDKKKNITNKIQTDVKSKITDNLIKINQIADKVPGVSSVEENSIIESITNQIYSNPNQVDTIINNAEKRYYEKLQEALKKENDMMAARVVDVLTQSKRKFNQNDVIKILSQFIKQADIPTKEAQFEEWQRSWIASLQEIEKKTGEIITIMAQRANLEGQPFDQQKEENQIFTIDIESETEQSEALEKLQNRLNNEKSLLKSAQDKKKLENLRV